MSCARPQVSQRTPLPDLQATPDSQIEI
jgi:hypothetical protein